jgi:hypothetical protein
VIDGGGAFPGRPKLQKGGLAVYPTQTAGAQPSRIIVFQFNPDQMKRTLANRAVQPPSGGTSGAAREDVLRVGGPPVETINLTVELHAADQLGNPDQNDLIARNGLHPALATLELLMYPPSPQVEQIQSQAGQGAVQVSPPTVPLVLLVWGRSRVVPVRLTSFSISEEAFDSRLDPIDAKVELGMQVLTYIEFPASSVGRDAFLSYPKAKEALAGQAPGAADDRGVRTLLTP